MGIICLLFTIQRYKKSLIIQKKSHFILLNNVKTEKRTKGHFFSEIAPYNTSTAQRRDKAMTESSKISDHFLDVGEKMSEILEVSLTSQSLCTTFVLEERFRTLLLNPFRLFLEEYLDFKNAYHDKPKATERENLR